MSGTDDLATRLDEAWALVTGAARNRRSPCHTPVVATVDPSGLPQLRVMVLREAIPESRLLRFHTDVRSHKISQLGQSNAVSVLLYDAALNVQLRLSGSAQIVTDGQDIDDIWHDAERYARRCYMAEAAPGSVADGPTSGLPSWVQGIKPEESDLVPARANFAVLRVTIDRIDWLYLATTGHRRAAWDYDTGAHKWSGRWLIP